MGVKWRELIKECDQRSWVNDKQYGARPGCEASSLALYREIRTDIAYVTRRMLASVDNDADSCFDRMVPSLISLNNLYFGLPLELAQLHGKSLSNMWYHLRTDYPRHSIHTLQHYLFTARGKDQATLRFCGY
jgi:hypothetical protein